MLSHQIASALRAVPSLAFAATLAVSAFGPPAPVGAGPEPPEPRARLELVVKQVNIVDDRDPWILGGGEMSLKVDIWRCKGDEPPPCRLGPGTRLAGAGAFINAGEGETVTLNLEVPQAGDLTVVEDTSRELGFAVYPGYHYAVGFEMSEWDGGLGNEVGSDDDHMGFVFHVLDAGENGLGIGTHTRLSKRDAGSDGDFVVTYEVRRVPLPDLAPVSIWVDDLPGSPKKRVCMTVVNRGDVHAGPFVVNLSVDGNVPPDGLYTVGVVGAGMDYLTCVETTLPTAGDYELAAVVDKARVVTEYNEANNVHRQTFTATPSSSSSSTSQGQGQADLTASAIRVRGQIPDGKDDCKDGKNDVAVVVKNAGAAKAGDFAVRLVVDGNSGAAKEEFLADGLDAGQEREVRFDDVRLKKGEHTLAASLDSEGTVAESNENNNELKVTAGCHDGN